MALTKDQAQSITDLVAADERCAKHIDSTFAAFLPDTIGFAGGTRNFAMVIGNLPSDVIGLLVDPVGNLVREGAYYVGHNYVHPYLPSEPQGRWKLWRPFDNADPEIEAYICIGIANLTVEAINAGVKVGTLKKAGVKEAVFCDRATGIAHAATRVKMADETDYVFDWHCTLNVKNPMVYQTEDWHNCTGGETLANFEGYKDFKAKSGR